MWRLSRSDIDSLKAVGNSKGALDQASLLYEIVQTRIQGYEKLTKSIFECLQTGALKILLEGFEENQIKNPFAVCDINLDVDKFMRLSATFMGKTCTISDICGEIPETKLQEILQSTLNASLYFQLFQAKGNQSKLNIVKNTIPEPLKFYVPRSLSAALVLDPEVFMETTDDVFVFTNIERHQLTLLVRPNKTATSEEINHVAYIRFILLCSDEDLDDIRDTFADSNVHLIKYMPETKQCILERTWGDTHFIRQFMNSEITVTENEFMKLSQDNGYKGICICDTPGMGKSVLLANLARNIANEDSQKICIFISLAKLVSEDFTTTLPKSKRHVTSAVRKLVFAYISSSPLEEYILNEIMTMKSKQVELFFDGFDEISDSAVSWAKEFLKISTTAFPNGHIYVTSRPHMQQALEETLGVIGYKILPFDKINQINFLVNYWKGEMKNSVESKLIIFAQECLDTLERKISSTERDLAGVPIQCRILAEVLKNDAKLALRRNTSRSEVSRILSSIFDMYSEFMKMRFARESISEVRSQLQACHVLLAIDLIFPQMTDCCKSLLDISTFPIVDTVPLFNIGILEGQLNENSCNLQFVHRTFAEFLIAQFFASLGVSNNKYEKIDPLAYTTAINFFGKTFLTAKSKAKHIYYYQIQFSFMTMPMLQNDKKSLTISVSYPLINYFLNGHKEHITTNEYSSPFNRYSALFEKHNLYQFLMYCLRENHSNIFECMVPVMFTFNNKKLQSFRKFFKVRKNAARLLYIAISFCETRTVEKCFELYLKYFNFDLQLLTNFPIFDDVFPIQIAAQRGHYGMVEFLIEQCKFPFKNRNLIKHIIDTENFYNNENTSDRIQIIKYLVNKDPTLLEVAEFTDYYGKKVWKISPIYINPGIYMSKDSHVEILQCLINEGANVLTTDENSSTFLKAKARCLNAESLHKLIYFLSEHSDALKLFSAVNKHHCTLLHQLMACDDLMPQTLELVLRITNMNINVRNQDQETPLFAAIRKRQNENVFKFLLERGSNIKRTNYTGGNILDVMKRHANEIPILVFLSSGEYDNLRSHKHGNTLLHLAAMKTSPVAFDDCVKLLIKRNNFIIFQTKNYFGFTPLQLAIQHMNVLEDTLELIISHTGMDINSEDKLGETLLFTAIRNFGIHRRSTLVTLELIRKLLDFGADFKKKNKEGETVLHLAVRLRHMEIVLYLTKLGANVTEKNISGESPLDIAKQKISKPRSRSYLETYEDIVDVLRLEVQKMV